MLPSMSLFANNLQYYKPYKLREEHRVQIKRQIEEAQDIIEDELYDFRRQQRQRDTLSEVRAPPKNEDESMEDAPSTAAELPAVQEQPYKKDVDEEPFVSTLTTEQPNQAMKDATPEPQPQRDEPMEDEPAIAGAEVDTKAEEEENTIADEKAEVTVKDDGQTSHNEANTEDAKEIKDDDKEARGGDEEAITNAENEAQAEADMIDEHHGETVVEAEEDTVIY